MIGGNVNAMRIYIEKVEKRNFYKVAEHACVPCLLE